ncbi:glycosyltransferase family 2 protein [Primorskyibacter sp. S87]|uniref:glycosyltransferase family 2 protein n=1 Tax=Primorskyibacter sp. S87 TaxID=3415126 RepID=UPI003C798C85
MPDLSICIPAYDMGGDGARFLRESLDVLKKQTFRSFEVIVSDQSDESAVQEVCDAAGAGMAVRHLWFREGKRQASANCNNAIRHARGDIVKVLFQDDLLSGDDALEKIAAGFADPHVSWALCGSGVTRDGTTVERPMIPRMHPQIHFGKNTVSSPSVLAARRDKVLEFDEDLIWLMDVEIYRRYELQYGPPAILPDTLILNRLHAGQVSAGVTPDLRRRELAYVRQKFSGSEAFRDRLAYLKQVLKAR